MLIPYLRLDESLYIGLRIHGYCPYSPGIQFYMGLDKIFAKMAPSIHIEQHEKFLRDYMIRRKAFYYGFHNLAIGGCIFKGIEVDIS